ncbi:MAG: hypothetical protein JWM53_3415 [bacterium]|nr:hypothetical protein [bacterium]
MTTMTTSMRISLLAAALLFTVVSLAPRLAHAQRGIDAQLFRPALDGYGIFTVERAQTAHQWDFGVKLYADYAANPLRLGLLRDASGAPDVQTMIDRQVAVHLAAHLGLTNWLQLAVDLPLSAQHYTAAYGSPGSYAGAGLQRTGFYGGDAPYTNVAPPDAAPLDLRLALKARLVRRGLFGLAFAAVATIPFGDKSAFLGDSGFTFRPILIADVTRGPITVAVNVGVIVRGETVVRAPGEDRALLDVGHELTWSAGAAYRFVRMAGVAAEIYGLVPLVHSASGPLDGGRDYTAEALAGFQFFPRKDLIIAAGGGSSVIRSALRRDDYRAFVGVTWAPAAGRGALTAATADSDGDGIPDDVDACPLEAEDKDQFDDEDGCPEPDNDQDGIADALDRCPNEPEDRDTFQDDDGCPDLDNDRDGVPDVQDKCPSEPEDRDGFQDDDGCPELDNDGDGVADANDKCPNEAETFNGVDDQDGCPDSGGAVVIAGGRFELPENVLFESSRATISPRSEALLARVADKIKANPGLKRVRIEGHSDDLGTARKNHDLSQARADAVRAFLMAKGVEPERLQAIGYGDTRPLDKRRTGEARAKNRRVELIVVEQ